MIKTRKDIKKFTIILLFCLGLLLSGCSDDDTDDILPNVVLSVNELNFEEVDLDAFRIETVTVRNLTNGNVIIERVTSTNDVFQVGGYFASNQLIELETPFTIEANGARTLYIGFYPDAVQAFVGKVVIESVTENSTREETDLVDLQGVGIRIDD